MNISLKFHKDPSFRCGDICKTIMTLSSRVKITWCFGYFSKDFLSKMFLLISKKRPLETFQILLRWFGTHSEIVRMSSDPLTHSKKPILCSGSVWSVCLCVCLSQILGMNITYENLGPWRFQSEAIAIPMTLTITWIITMYGCMEGVWWLKV